MAGSTSSKTQPGKLGLKASKEYSSDIYLYAGDINEDGYEALLADVSETTRSDKAILILITNGGSGAAAFKIARLFQNTYSRFGIFAPGQCKSAGTIVALGAHNIWMSPGAELGPIDAQVPQPDEIATIESSLSSRASLDALMDATIQFFDTSVANLVTKSQGSVSFKLAAEISGSMATSMVSSLVAKIDPTLLGRHRRGVSEGIRYGTELALVSGNAEEGTVASLANDYPCHGFVIDFVQAGKLFRDICLAEGTLLEYGKQLTDAVRIFPEGAVSAGILHRTITQVGSGSKRTPEPKPTRQANDDRPRQADEVSQKAA
ncbi:hypothetical protein [Mesorhizobium sp. M8A.F.Ca.ET.021.01.1.1]|uniref:SDH family Clp fold serine proteinase n=1 Tax=Mesorhizobium sp. M8A.F.Ca.ET.021.01.1.1 TaxID=2496757 RepID=UPI000FCB2236|nr:hypothetical protein [Mesorhizobium sp. M8A.F.Ca.ET.021.01.1.1]RUW56993.1 hypothetical protein EOA36_01390 [Mesorhizobium sp. M8A.F.Ca.ET.021.01.1.1]